MRYKIRIHIDKARSETNGMHNTGPSRLKCEQSKEFRASANVNIESEIGLRNFLSVLPERANVDNP